MKQFENVKVNAPKHSFFNLSHERKMSTKMGDLTPILCEEIIPGDSFKVRAEVLTRVMSMLSPVMHRLNVYLHFFFVPNRLVWEDWEKFITGDFDGDDETSIPTVTGSFAHYDNRMGEGSLSDYLGLPNSPNLSGSYFNPINLLPFRAYKKIFKDYYADENQDTTDELDISTTNLVLGSYTGDLFELRKRNWEKDYFTSALPWAQRGNAVTIPLGDTAPLNFTYDGGATLLQNYTDGSVIENENFTPFEWALSSGGLVRASNTNNVNINVSQTHEADLSNATAAEISTLRTAFALQRWQEKNARGGVRYTELILSHFGVRSRDSRLQRAEYLGGGKLPIRISEVLQTSETSTTPLGDFAGHGYAEGSTPSFKSYFTEHGIIMGIMSIMPRTGYFQGIPKFFSKRDRYDFFWPDFAHIGEQPILNKELYFDDNETVNDETFGYQPRYEEYRYKSDSVHGNFKSTLDYWHLARKFSSTPTLSESFIEADVTDRFLAVQDGSDYMLTQIYLDIQARRPIPKFGNPI